MDNSWVRFGKRFCAGKHTGYGWDFSGASNIETLHQETKEYVLRRTKETHLNLPDKNVFPVYLGLEDKKGYDLVVEEAYQKRWEESRDIESTKFGSDPLAAEQLVTFSIIRKFLAYEKIKDGSTLGAIEDAIAEDKKVVVFTNYTGVIDALLEELGDSCTFIDGRLTKEGEKQANVDRFQTDPKCKVILCNYAVGKMGWNLTAGRVTVMNDMNWSPETNMQAQDRIYRIGQEYSVNILYLLYEGTVETLLHEIIMLKIQIIRHAVDGIPMTDDPARLKVLSEQLFGSLDKRN
jgi:SWI/SNF-related matrix-associated actin-dependent regulator 1 of chromatin subfamily A